MMHFEKEFSGVPSRVLRHKFLRALLSGARVLWPIISGLIALIVSLGLLIGWIEGWRIYDSIYFAFVSGLTIGYGDFSPHFMSTKLLAVCIGLLGVLLTGLVAALGVNALSVVGNGLVSKEDSE